MCFWKVRILINSDGGKGAPSVRNVMMSSLLIEIHVRRWIFCLAEAPGNSSRGKLSNKEMFHLRLNPRLFAKDISRKESGEVFLDYQFNFLQNRGRYIVVIPPLVIEQFCHLLFRIIYQPNRVTHE